MILVAIATAGVASAETWTVDNDWAGADHDNIQDAINGSGIGDTIEVYAGTYQENINVTEEVYIIGNGSVNTTIDGSSAYAITLTSNNVTLSGFNVTNATRGVTTEASGFIIADNTFWNNSWAVHWEYYTSPYGKNPGADHIFYEVLIDGNVFAVNSDNPAVFIRLKVNYEDTGPYDVTVEDITFSGNEFFMNGTTAKGIHISDISVHELIGGNASIGDVTFERNRFWGGYNGISFFGTGDELDDVNLTIGNVSMIGNEVYGHSYAAFSIDYYDFTHNIGDTTATYGDLVCVNNVVNSSVSGSDGLYVGDIAYWEYCEDNASLVVGDVIVEGNHFDVDDYGYYADYSKLLYYCYDNVTVTMGDTYIGNNTMEDVNYGVYLYYGIFGEADDNASLVVGETFIHDNIINASPNAIKYIYYEFGYNTYGNSSCRIGDVFIEDNTLNCGLSCVDFYYDWGVPDYMYDNSSAYLGDVFILNNDITTGLGKAILVDTYDDNLGYYMQDNSILELHDFIVRGNNITSDRYGFVFKLYDEPYSMSGNSSIYLGSFTIDNNDFNCGYDAISIEFDYLCYPTYDDAKVEIGDIIVTDNNITSGMDGVYLSIAETYDACDRTNLTLGNITLTGNEVFGASWGFEIEISLDVDESVNLTAGTTTISQNVVHDVSMGIYLRCQYKINNDWEHQTGPIICTDNTIYNCTTDGIRITRYEAGTGSGSTSNPSGNISGNQVTNCGNHAMNINGLDGYVFADNNCSFNDQHGMYITATSNATFDGNEVTNNTWNGINMESCNDNDITNSVVFYNNLREDSNGAGIYIGECARNLLSGNLVSRNPIYGVNLDDVNNITMSGNEIVYNCGGVAGLTLNWAFDCVISWNNISNSTGTGIDIFYSDDNRFHNNTISGNNMDGNGNGGGIYTEYSHWNIYLDNVILDNNGIGTHIRFSENCTLERNDIGRNYPIGVNIWSSDNVTFTNNSVWMNDWNYGIYLYQTEYGNVTWNEVFNNSGYGICLYSCNYVNIYLNNVYGNGGTDSQGYDNSGTNTWDNGSHGNYWDDYNGTDGNGDGIGDTGYDLDGGSYLDEYPLTNATSNQAPREVPELTVLPVLAFLGTLFVIADIRRRRR